MSNEINTEDEQDEIVDHLSMSDEDVMNLPFPQDEDTSIEDAADEEGEEENDGEDDSGADTSDEPEPEASPDVVDNNPMGGDDTDTSNAPARKKSKATSTDPDDGNIDYKQQYERIISPFKANGKEVKVGNVEDAIQLMQMGANYNKKMVDMKSSMKYLKILEKNELLDENKLAYLIDLDKKNPTAISKLINDSGIDPLDFDTEGVGDYKPKSVAISDKEMELDTVLDDIRESDTYARTIDVISKVWDEPSKNILVDNPSIIKVINDQIGSGIYDQITGVIEQERMLGRLTDLSDLQAYKKVGDVLQANGAFDQKPTSKANVGATPQSKKKQDTELANRRKAAGTTKSTQGKNSKSVDPLKMSDADFEKLDMSSFA
jgi:hypothetical protein